MRPESSRRKPSRFTARAPRRNVSRRTAARQRRRWLAQLTTIVWIAAGVAATVFTSLFFVFVYDVLTQSDHFRARQIQIEGGQRVATRTLGEIAGVHANINLLKVNLSAVRRRLLAHPWIAEAAVRWDIPSQLHIRVREHEPLAIVDMGSKFLLNAEGEIFKEWEESDPPNLPVVHGLNVSDVRLADRSGTAAPLAWSWGQWSVPAAEPSRPMTSVLEVLTLATAAESALPLRQIRKIQVDRELGLTVLADGEAQTIRLGYDEYDTKLRLLADLMSFIKTQPGLTGFQRIDLTDTNRVIINPTKTEVAARTSPKGG